MPTYPLLGLSVVKNEADIIEAMVRHNLRYLDHMVIYDNGSLDGTVDILHALAAETGRVEVRIDTRAGHLQKRIINGFLRTRALEYEPTQVVLLDGDELICADVDMFRDTLLNCSDPVSIGWTTFVPTATDDLSILNPALRIQHRRVKELPLYRKTTVPAPAIGQSRVTAGSHVLKRDRAVIKAAFFDEIKIAHYPVRTKNQILTKALLGHWSIRQRTGDEREGRQWHQIAAKYLENGRMDDDDFFEVAKMYAAKQAPELIHQPLGYDTSLSLKYFDLGRIDPLFALAHFTEDLIVRKK